MLETIGRYRIERQLGAGGMGVVYAAFDPELERRVAIKVLRSTSSDARARLLREARALAKLTHPNVVTVHEVGSLDTTDFVAMELVDGEPLADWLAARRRSPAEILDVFTAAGRGLAAAHAVGLVHRDFKPHNVLRCRDGRVVVIDFGLARTAADGSEPASHAASSTDTLLTATGAWLGTPAYMAPEQWEGTGVTASVDQFAFCVSLWEALAGQRPFGGTTLDELHTAVMAGLPRGGDDKIPHRVRSVLRRGLERAPANRYPSVQALLEALAPPAARRATRIIVVALMLAMVATLGLWVVHLQRPRRLESPAAGISKYADAVRVTPAAMQRVLGALRTHPNVRFVVAMEKGAPIGLKLFGLRAGTLLDAIGLLNGDVIVGLDDQPIADERQLNAALAALPASPASVTIRLQRAGRPTDLHLEPVRDRSR